MPDRTEIEEEERDHAATATDEAEAVDTDDMEWSAESALPEHDEDEAVEREKVEDGAHENGSPSSAGDVPTEALRVVEPSEDEETSEASAVTTQTPAVDEPTKEAAPAPDAETSEAEDESKKRPWVPWLVGIPIVIAIALAVGFLLADLGGDSGDGPGNVNDPKLRGVQADWEVRSYVIGGRYLKDAPKEVPDGVEGDLTRVVTDIHDALFLRPSQLDAVTKKFFSPPAAKAFERADIGIPKNADEVQTTRRVARIGVDAAGMSRAAVLVQIAAEGEAGSQSFRSAAESKLYLQRIESGWKVIGYDVLQRPGDPFAKEKKAKADGKKGDDKGKDAKKGKGKK